MQPLASIGIGRNVKEKLKLSDLRIIFNIAINTKTQPKLNFRKDTT
jgi:hypothetical protein